MAGRYELGAPIGEGNFSITYRALDLVLGRDVAIKILREQYFAHAGFSSRFETEARVSALISHPHVVQVFDYGREDHTAYIVMQFVNGPSLKDYIREEGPLTIEESVAFSLQILDGLAAIHDAGIIHRDVKPQNILLADGRQVKVTDFGIARIRNAEAGLTETGTALGTAAYMAPEQASGNAVVPATDLYSVGVILYEMLTRRMPFPGENPVQVMYRHVNELPPTPRTLNPRIPVPLEAVLLRALAKSPEDRFPSARAMQDALEYPSAYVAPVASHAQTTDPDAVTSVAPIIAAAPVRATPRPRRPTPHPVPVSRPPARRSIGERRVQAIVPIVVLALLLVLVGAIALANPGGDDESPGAGVVFDATETPEAAPSPTEIAAVIPVDEPTATEAPTETPEPTATPEPSSTPEPTATQEPTATPEPEPTEAPDDSPTTATSIAGGQFDVPLASLTIPQHVGEGPRVDLSAEDFTGAYRRPDGMLFGRPATHIYGVGSDAHAATATFEIAEAPGSYILVTITGMDDERPEKVPMRLWLNDRIIWEGPSPFPNESWLNVSWLVSDLSALQAGQNSITVEVTEGNGAIGRPPWILITSAIVYYG
ncbi:MAG TPA: protein kinase [Thermomicrobiales bacterium]|nr:protein kinase [Thermomicrobiales bacterium]